MCDFTQGVKWRLSVKKYSVFIQPRFVVACVFFDRYLGRTHTQKKKSIEDIWFVSWVQEVLFLKRLAVISQSYGAPAGFRVSCEKSFTTRGWATWPVPHSAWGITSKMQQGLGHATVEIITEWKAYRVVDSFKNGVGLCWFDCNGRSLSHYPCGLCF